MQFHCPAGSRFGPVPMPRQHKHGVSTRVLLYSLAPNPAAYRGAASVEWSPPRTGRRRDYGEPRPREPSEVMPEPKALKRRARKRNKANRRATNAKSAPTH